MPSDDDSSSSSQTGLKKTIEEIATDKQAREVATMLTAGVHVDAATQLGLNFRQNQYEQRRKALIQPKDYADERAAAYSELTKAVNDQYSAAAKKYVESGLPPEVAKKFALQAASNEAEIQQQMFELRFPSGANVLELGAQAHRFQGLGDVTAPPRRRAPARRRRR